MLKTIVKFWLKVKSIFRYGYPEVTAITLYLLFFNLVFPIIEANSERYQNSKIVFWIIISTAIIMDIMLVLGIIIARKSKEKKEVFFATIKKILQYIIATIVFVISGFLMSYTTFVNIIYYNTRLSSILLVIVGISVIGFCTYFYLKTCEKISKK